MIPLEMRAGRTTEELPDAQGGEFGMYEHLERLTSTETEVSEEENKLLAKVLETALPGLDQFLNDERHTMLKGKMRYNAIGICYNGGRDDKVCCVYLTAVLEFNGSDLPQPVSTDRPEDVEKTRTPYGTSRQVGSGLYIVSSYVRSSSDLDLHGPLTDLHTDCSFMRTIHAHIIRQGHIRALPDRHQRHQERGRDHNVLRRCDPTS
jgi:mitochondrial import receptor subunit TOM20